MAEESEPLPEPTHPSISQGARATSFINERVGLAEQLKVALQCLDAALEALGGGMTIDAVTTMKRPLAAIVRVHDSLDIRRGTKTPMGS